MGGQLSKKPAEIADLEYETELDSYEAECRIDPVLKSFDSKVHLRTDHMINTLATGVEVRALSIDSLKEVTQCLLDMNQEVVKVILECKDDVWNHQELFDLVNDYLENSLEILRFCDSLEKCLKQARNNQLLVLVALEQFDETTENKYDRTLEELRNFKAAGSPFTQEFFETFRSVYSHQVTMLQKLKIKKNKLDKKLKFIHSWRKISNVMFVSIFASILICSVVAAAVAAPPVAAALAAAASIPLGSMGKWIDSLFKNFENALKGQKEAVNAMTTGGYVAIKDLDNIRVLIDRLEIEIESTVAAAEFAGTSEEEEGLKIAAVEIKKRVDVFMKIVEELGVQARSCGQDIHRARTVVLRRIIKPPIH